MLLILLIKIFSPSYSMHKLFNYKTIMICYSCKRNIDSIICSYCHNFLYPKPKTFCCNCQIKSDYPLEVKYLILKFFYCEDVTDNQNSEEKICLGFAGTMFEEPYINWTKHIRQVVYQKNTEFPKFIRNHKNGKWSVNTRPFQAAHVVMLFSDKH